MAVASLVLGIVSIVVAVFSGFFGGWFGAVLGIIGVVLGAIGTRNEEKRGMATAGLVCSIIGTALSLIMYVACASCVGGCASLF